MTKELREEIRTEIEIHVRSKAAYYSECLEEVDRATQSEYIDDEIMEYFNDEEFTSADEDEIFLMILDEMDRVFDEKIEAYREWVA